MFAFNRFAKPKSGAVLLLTFLILVVLLTLTVQFQYFSEVEYRIQKLREGQGKLYYTLRSGLAAVKEILRQDEPKVDHQKELWASSFSPLSLNGVTFSFQIWDGESRLNVNLLTEKKWKPILEKRLLRLCKILKIPEKVGKAIVDFVDTDKKGDYEQGAKNGKLEILEELRKIPFLKREHWEGEKEKKGLKDFLTLYSRGEININTASAQILQSLSETITKEKAEAIINRRKERPFEKVEELKEIAGLEKLWAEKEGKISLPETLSVKSFYFFARIEGENKGRRKKRLAVFYRAKEVQLLFWREE